MRRGGPSVRSTKEQRGILAFGIRHPNPALRPNGSFVQWSRLVLNALSWVNVGGAQASWLIQERRSDWLATGDDELQAWSDFALWTWRHTTQAGTWLDAASLVSLLDKLVMKPDMPEEVAERVLRDQGYASASSRGVSLGKHLSGVIGTAILLPTGEDEEEVILRFEARKNGMKAKKYSVSVEGPIEQYLASRRPQVMPGDATVTSITKPDFAAMATAGVA